MNFLTSRIKQIKDERLLKQIIRGLEKSGYKNGLTHFPGIDMLLNVPKNRYFRNDGMVPNIEEHAKLFMVGDYSMSKPETPSGLCISYTLDKYKVSTIFVNNLGKYSSLLLQGHESVHAIRDLGIEDQFLEKLNREGLYLRSFSEYKDEEVIASLGSLIADYNIKKFLFQNNPVLKPLYNEFLKKTDGWNGEDLTNIFLYNNSEGTNKKDIP